MSKNRDYIAEIISIRSRLLTETERLNHLAPRTSRLWGALAHVKNEVAEDIYYKSELLKYFPIGFVACIEGYFRLVYKDLVDHGSPYSENISGFRDVKFNIESVIAIHSKRAVSLGEFVSHLLSCNNLDDINRNMSVIIGDDFLARLIRARFQSKEGKSWTLEENNLHPWLFSNLKKLFELRHIYCHELAITEVPDIETIEACAHAAMFLMIFTDILMEELVLPVAT